jgi:general stress protein 26
MQVDSFDTFRDEFERRVREKVWCSVATVDRGGRPRSRVLHPIWEGTIGWITTNAGSHKAKHLEAMPFISCGYVDPSTPLYVDCAVEWVDDVDTKRRVWDYIKSQPEPYGFDPAFGLLKLKPWRIQLTTVGPGAPPETLIWRPRD